MNRRLDMVRSHMESNDLDACVFTSYHNIHYFSDFLFYYFGRPYAFIVTPTKTISVSAGKAISSFFQVSLWRFESMVFLDLTSPISKQRGRVEPWQRQRVVSSTRNFSLSCHSSLRGKFETTFVSVDIYSRKTIIVALINYSCFSVSYGKLPEARLFYPNLKPTGLKNIYFWCPTTIWLRNQL